MEPIGFAVGVIGLAGLYSICVQCMDQIDSGGDLGKDSQRLLAMLRADKYLLEKWGELVGINVDGSFGSGKYHKSLSTERGRSIIYNIFANTESILNDRDTLCKKYGLEAIKSSGTLGNMVTVIESTAASAQAKATISKRFMWDVKDKKKFLALVSDLGAFIEKLYSITSLENDDSSQSVVDLAKELNGMKLNLTKRLDC